MSLMAVKVGIKTVLLNMVSKVEIKTDEADGLNRVHKSELISIRTYVINSQIHIGSE